MRLHTVLSFALSLLLCVSGSVTVLAQDVAIDELKQEMKAPAENNPQVVKEAAEQAPAAELPVAADQAKPAEPRIEEVAPAAPVAPAAEPAAPAPAPAAVSPVGLPPVIAPEEAMKMIGTPERSEMAKLLSQQEEVRRQAREIEGRVSIDSADKAWKNGDYALALGNYRIALEKLPAVGPAMASRNRAMTRIPECEYQSVLTLVKLGKKDEALSSGKEMLGKNPDNKALAKLVAKLEQEKQPTKPKATVESVTEEKGSEVDDQMRNGKRQMAARDYDKARASFESVLAIEPENREAMRYLKELGDRQFVASTTERDATAAKMSAQVRSAWNPQYKMTKAAEVKETKTVTPSTSKSILDKMERIVIPEVEFRQANIHDVVEFLNKASVESDKSEQDPTRRGINIILNLNAGGGGAVSVAKPAGEGGLFDAPAQAAGASGGGQSSEITFTARYITLLSALKIITSVAGLKWRVDGNIVMIVPADYDPSEIEVRMYSVEPTFVERIREAGSAMPATPQNRGGRVLETLGNEPSATALPELRDYFEKMGVRFPKGSSITYNSAIGKVIVGNTAENLATFERILPELNVVPKQVEIEARFVEVNETDLSEMGLEWLMTDAWEMANKKGGPYSSPGSTERIQMNANSGSGGFTKGNRFFGTDSANSTTALGEGKGTMGAILSVSSVLTNPELTMVLHMLQQNGNADLLSAPKVTTRAGGPEATIRVVTEYIYPTSFDVQGGTLQGAGTGGGAQTVQETTVVPQDFATREVGVILTVQPEVSPDGNMINLTMTPQVVTEPTWFQYGSTVRRADGSSTILNMPQPFFHVRSISTQISIYDGATVVMGGLITEDLQKINDKIPVLGDIPLLGVLFRSKAERSVKKNLLIFVTAKLVDPGGRLIRETSSETARLRAPVPAAEATPR
jgi:general secretion pathway protein D